jgi:hypothetical protein
VDPRTGDVVTALAGHGLRIEKLTEQEETFFPRFPFLVETQPKVFCMPAGRPRFPLSYSLIASKPHLPGAGQVVDCALLPHTPCPEPRRFA